MHLCTCESCCSARLKNTPYRAYLNARCPAPPSSHAPSRWRRPRRQPSSSSSGQHRRNRMRRRQRRSMPPPPSRRRSFNQATACLAISRASEIGKRRWWWACTRTARTRSSIRTRDSSRSMCRLAACSPPVALRLRQARHQARRRDRRRDRRRACGHRVRLQACQRVVRSSRAIACLATSRASEIGTRPWWWACMRTARTRSSIRTKGSWRSMCRLAACDPPVALRLRRPVRHRGLDHLLDLRQAYGHQDRHQDRRRDRLRACGHQVRLQACRRVVRSSRATV